jgi:hypothetical protein
MRVVGLFALILVMSSEVATAADFYADRLVTTLTNTGGYRNLRILGTRVDDHTAVAYLSGDMQFATGWVSDWFIANCDLVNSGARWICAVNRIAGQATAIDAK